MWRLMSSTLSPYIGQQSESTYIVVRLDQFFHVIELVRSFCRDGTNMPITAQNSSYKPFILIRIVYDCLCTCYYRQCVKCSVTNVGRTADFSIIFFPSNSGLPHNVEVFPTSIDSTCIFTVIWLFNFSTTFAMERSAMWIWDCRHTNWNAKFTKSLSEECN